MRTLRKNMTHNGALKQDGFTLIEMAIVITILGFIIAATTTAYVQWQTWLQQETTRTNVEDAHAAIQDFLSTNGRYPCPASLQADRTDGALYGLEPTGANSCNNVVAGNIDMSVPLDGIPDIYVAAGARAVEEYIDNAGNAQDGGDGPGGVLATPQIRIGMIPFRALGIDEEQAYDGHRNRLYYAVTDHMASSIGFDNGTTGTISIVGDDGVTSLTGTNGDVHFLVFSAGENGAGAFNREGVQLACPAGIAIENENCDLNDATFRLGNYSTANGVNAMDDRMAFGVSEIPHFERPVGGDLDDGVTKSAANLGIGGVKDNPAEEIDVAGVIRAQDDPSTPGDEGKIQATHLCENASDADCFTIESIAGALADGEGMTCGAGLYVIGIQNNTPVCGVIETGCSGNEVIIGIDASGNAICSGSTGNPSCPTTTVPICSTTGTLLFGVHGTIRTITGGLTRSESYICDAGTWRPNGSSGLCSCTPTPPTNGTRACRASNNTCGPRYTGTEDIQVTAVTCPSGNSSTIVLDSSRCTCDPTSRRTSGRNCSGASSWWRSFVPTVLPGGYSFNTGRINLENRTDCTNPATPTCTGWQLDNENCGCVNDSRTDTRSCTSGYAGTRTRSRNYTCVGGGGVGDYGRWSPWTAWDVTGCTCDTATVVPGLIQCRDAQAGWTPKPAGPGGIRTETRKTDTGSACVSTTTEIDALADVCDPPPPVQCAWQTGGSSAPGSHPTNIAGIPGGCACGTGNAPCQQGALRYSNCSCDPI